MADRLGPSPNTRSAIPILKGSPPIMTNVYTLADLKKSLDTKYRPIEIDGVVLRNVMRLNGEERKKVVAIGEELKTDDENEQDPDEMLDAIKRLVTLVAEGNGGKKLADAIGDDLALGMEILNVWNEATQPGEAQNSPS